MREKKKISAVVLAAGLSSRMGDYKPLMDLNGKSALERVISLFKGNNVDDIIVVTGHNRKISEPEIKKYGARAVFNDLYESGMLSSVQTGVKSVSDCSGFFILPVDIPAIRKSSIRKIIDFFDGTKIIMPFFGERSGHPPLVPMKFRNEILGLDKNSTMHTFFDSFIERTHSVNLLDRGILLDMDNRDQFKNVERKLNKIDIPDFYECLAVLKCYIKNNDKLLSHLKTVSRASLIIVNSIKTNLDRDLIAASSLLHDISKGEENHANKGADLMESLGFKKVADVIREHMDIEIDMEKEIEEKEIVYFADKICSQNRIELNYEEKFNRKKTMFPLAQTEIRKRYENTRIIQTRIERNAGKSLEEVFKER